MQSHLEITSKTKLWTRNVRDWTKTLTSVMSGLAKAMSWIPTENKPYFHYLGVGWKLSSIVAAAKIR